MLPPGLTIPRSRVRVQTPSLVLLGEGETERNWGEKSRFRTESKLKSHFLVFSFLLKKRSSISQETWGRRGRGGSRGKCSTERRKDDRRVFTTLLMNFSQSFFRVGCFVGKFGHTF